MPILKTDIREVNSEEAAAESAKMTLNGVGINKQVQILSEMFTFNFTRSQVLRLQKRDVYVSVIEEFKKNVVKKAVSDLHTGVSELIPDVIATLKQHLSERNLQAVPMAVKIIGGEAQIEEKQQQAQNITVVLPGSKIE